MKKCPKCNTKHEKSGIYCSHKCANSRKFSPESRERKSKANKQYWGQMSTKEQEEKKKFLATVMPYSKQRYLNSVLFEDCNFLSIDSKRLRVILEQEGKCNKCQLLEWLGKPITLEYEHKDGDNTNDLRDNDEALCPNCHSQTSTWRGRKNGIKQSRVIEYIELSKGV